MDFSEGILQLLIQLHTVCPPIFYHSLDCFVHGFRAVVCKRCDNVFGHGVCSCVTGEAFVHIDEFGDVRSSDNWGAPGVLMWHFFLFIHDGKGQWVDELPSIACMIGQGIGI